MIIRWLVRLYHALLYLYPRSFRAEFAEEMQEVFSQAVEAASVKSVFSLAYLCLNELVSLPVSLARVHRSGRINRPIYSALPLQKTIAFAQPWQELILIFAVFLLPAGVILINHSPQTPVPIDRLAALLFLGVMFLMGWLGGFPLWSLPYIGVVLVIGAYLFLFGWVVSLVSPSLIIFPLAPGPLVPSNPIDRSAYLLLQVISTGMVWLMLFCMTLLATALLAVFNSFQLLLGRVRHEWTLLSYILYAESAFVLLVLFESRRFDPNYAIAGALCLLSGAWLFLRSPVRWQRLLALTGCLTLAVGIAVLDRWPLDFAVAGVSWNDLRPTDVGRLLLSWVWMILALLLPGLLVRIPSKRGHTQPPRTI